jgi:hypothetical protein
MVAEMHLLLAHEITIPVIHEGDGNGTYDDK